MTKQTIGKIAKGIACPGIGAGIGGGVGAYVGASIGIAAFGTAVAGTWPILAVGALAGGVVGYAGREIYKRSTRTSPQAKSDVE